MLAWETSRTRRRSDAPIRDFGTRPRAGPSHGNPSLASGRDASPERPSSLVRPVLTASRDAATNGTKVAATDSTKVAKAVAPSSSPAVPHGLLGRQWSLQSHAL